MPAERLLDNLKTAIVALDRRLTLCYMNQAAEMLFAVSFRQARGTPFAQLAPGTGAMLDGLRRCLRGQQAYTERELRLRLGPDREVTVDATVSALPPPDPGAEATLLVELSQLDQHLRISREEQLLAQQQTSKTLIRNLAHEIKNPLGGLRGAAQLLERELATAALREYTQIIIGEADRLRNLVDRMLGPIRPPARRELNIHEVLERVRALVLAEQDGERSTPLIEQDYDPSIPPLYGDAEQLIQALLNIVRNAVQAPARRIVLRTRVQRQSSIGLQRHKLVVRLDVCDDGPGIPVALREDIFFPTISGRSEGTGLGLSIAQSIVGQHGGLIEHRSRPGDTVFTLLLPLAKGAQCD